MGAIQCQPRRKYRCENQRSIDRRLVWKLWSSFVILANHAFKVGARILIELPRGCSYWDDPRMSKFLKQHKFGFADFDDCMYGFVAKYGLVAGHPMHKPWRFACWKSSLPSRLHLK